MQHPTIYNTKIQSIIDYSFINKILPPESDIPSEESILVEASITNSRKFNNSSKPSNHSLYCLSSIVTLLSRISIYITLVDLLLLPALVLASY